ncbi:MAG: hypothetical protein KGY76_06945 [Candidatus Thermoplasmatota archaeon]|nr:hypothetical protein [Candidatus Thermoplasmatota archaeon]
MRIIQKNRTMVVCSIIFLIIGILGATAAATSHPVEEDDGVDLSEIQSSREKEMSNTTVSEFKFQNISSPKTAGGNFSITITAYDETDNISENYTGRCLLTDDTGTISPAESDNFTDGRWTGDVTITEAQENIRIRAEDVTNNSITGESGSFAVEPAGLDHIGISPQGQNVTPGESVVYTAISYDVFGNKIADVTENTSWNIDSEAGGNWNGNVYTSENAGEWKVTGTYDGMTDNATLSVRPQQYFDFSSINSPQTAGEQFEISITVLDENETVVQDYDGTAALSDTTETIEPEQISFTNGTWTGDVSIYEAAEDIEIKAESLDENITGNSGQFDVEHNKAVLIEARPGRSSIRAGDTQEYYAVASDNYDNRFNVTRDTNWSDDIETSTWNENAVTPITAGEWTVTAEYQDLVDEALLVVASAEEDRLEIEPREETIMSKMSIEFTLLAFDRYDNEIGDVSGEANWEIENEAGGSWDGSAYTAENTGTWEVIGSYDGLEATAQLTVEELEPDHIKIEPQESTIQAGDTQDYSAVAYDENGQKIVEVTDESDWNISGKAGGSWSNNVYSSEYAGEWTVSGSYKGISDSGDLTVEPGEMARMMITPVEQTITAGERQSYNSMAYDEFGNEIKEVTDETDWEIDDEAEGNWDGNTYSSEVAGEWTVTGEYESTTDKAKLTVGVGEESDIVIYPQQKENVTAGERKDFSAFVYDKMGNEIREVTDEASWSIVEGTDKAGGSWDGNTYTAEKAGNWTVKADYEEISEIRGVRVRPSDAATVIIEPREDQNIAGGKTLTFSAEAYDEYNNSITSDPADFYWKNATEGVFERDQGGTYEVRAEYEGVKSSTVTVDVEESADERSFMDSLPSGNWLLILLLIGLGTVVVSGIILFLSGRGEAS